MVTPCDSAPTVLVVPDGASEPLRGDTATSLELAATPVWDRLAAQGRALAVATVPRRLPPGTEVGLPMLLGVSVSMAPARGRIEAAAAGVELAAGQAAWRVDARRRRASRHRRRRVARAGPGLLGRAGPGRRRRRRVAMGPRRRRRRAPRSACPRRPTAPGRQRRRGRAGPGSLAGL
ncbi:MAG: hypothetical protein BRC32_03885 [Actinobacteria bacterium QS_8_72_14]|nr:MAG: hypothetical protein BRC32_03885 [Actinobacteria bacterium QS_8_72_14]